MTVPTPCDARPPAGFSIRKATNVDIPAIRAVLFAVRDEYGVLCDIGANDVDLNDLEQNYFQRGGLFEVIEDGGQRIVGCAGLYPLSPQRAELCKMYLEACVRGRGFGKQLLARGLAWARQNGFAEVWLETNSALTEAIALYKKHGFERVTGDQLLQACDQAYLLRLDGARPLAC